MSTSVNSARKSLDPQLREHASHMPESLPACETAPVKSVLFGLLLLPAAALAILSIRPGGLRRQLRHVRRRFKIAIVLGGVYLVASTAARLLLPEGTALDYLLAGTGAVLGITFVVLAQDPAEARP